MLRTLQDLRWCSLAAKDGDAGSIRDVLIDETTWTIRCFVLDTWRPGRHALVPPALVSNIDWGALYIELDATRGDIAHAMELEPEQLRFGHHDDNRATRCERGWGNATLATRLVLSRGGLPLKAVSASSSVREVTFADGHARAGQPRLRTQDEFKRFQVHAIDGAVGHIDDFIIDESWAVQYAIVNPAGRASLEGVVISIGWVRRIDWRMSHLSMDRTKAEIYSSPKYRPQIVLRHG